MLKGLCATPKPDVIPKRIMQNSKVSSSSQNQGTSEMLLITWTYTPQLTNYGHFFLTTYKTVCLFLCMSFVYFKDLFQRFCQFFKEFKFYFSKATWIPQEENIVWGEKQQIACLDKFICCVRALQRWQCKGSNWEQRAGLWRTLVAMSSRDIVGKGIFNNNKTLGVNYLGTLMLEGLAKTKYISSPDCVRSVDQCASKHWYSVPPDPLIFHAKWFRPLTSVFF